MSSADQHSAPPPLGAVTVRDNGIEVIDAPEYVGISLEVVANADPRLLVVRGAQITFRGGVSYNVTGWDEQRRCLLAWRDDA